MQDNRIKRVKFDCQLKYIDVKATTAEGLSPIDHMMVQAKNLTKQLRNIMNQHTEDLMETANHARMHRDSFSKQLTYTILETVLVVLANILQLYYIRRLFESKHIV